MTYHYHHSEGVDQGAEGMKPSGGVQTPQGDAEGEEQHNAPNTLEKAESTYQAERRVGANSNMGVSEAFLRLVAQVPWTRISKRLMSKVSAV